jgi:integrative and conjugative element protein (TIGR02256 family)
LSNVNFIRYTIGNEKFLEISSKAIRVFEKYKQINGKNEAGGILLGRCYKDKIVIEHVTSPNSSDKAGPAFFERNRGKAQNIVNEEWNVSEGERIYLGEWHTHCEPRPHPSKTDRDMICNMLKDTIMEIDFLFTIIVGTHDYWVGYQKGKKLTELKCVKKKETDAKGFSLRYYLCTH